MITIYQAVDGKTFSTEGDCLAYEKQRAVTLYVFNNLPTDALIGQAAANDPDGIRTTVANFILTNWQALQDAVTKAQSI